VAHHFQNLGWTTIDRGHRQGGIADDSLVQIRDHPHCAVLPRRFCRRSDATTRPMTFPTAEFASLLEIGQRVCRWNCTSVKQLNFAGHCSAFANRSLTRAGRLSASLKAAAASGRGERFAVRPAHRRSTAGGLQYKRGNTEVCLRCASSNRRFAAASTRSCNRSSFIEVMYLQCSTAVRPSSTAKRLASDRLRDLLDHTLCR